MFNREKRKPGGSGEQRSKTNDPSGGKEIVTKIRSEREVGIILHLSNHQRFDAVVKERYSDFHVNEIDPNGQIVRLTSYELPKDPREVVDENDPIFSKWLSEDIRVRIQKMQAVASECITKQLETSVEIKVTDASKEERTKIHRWLSIWDKLCSETVDKDNEKLIVASIKNPTGRRDFRRPASRARYTHCVLYKEGIETTDAITYLSIKLKYRPDHITYAGTKDKQAKTTQRLCFSNVDAARLLEVNKYSTVSKMGNFSYQTQKLNLGDLSGNHFTILLKNVLADSDDVIDFAINNLGTQGFINYFGLQRFGSYSVPTHLIGKAMIQMKYDQVVDLILAPKRNDPDFMTEAKKVWFTKRNPQEAFKLIPSWCRSIDANLLYGLSKSGRNDFYGALSSIPRNLRLLYLHSYQSYTWNRVTSYRIKEYGLVPVVGDLVYADSQQVDSSLDPVDEAGVEDANSPEDPSAIKVLLTNTVTPDLSRKIPEVKVLTADDIPNYTIYDVVIPLQGTEVQYPKNKVTEYFEQLFLDGGIGEDSLQKFASRPDAPKGAYRKLVVIPKDVSYKVIPYSDDDNLDTFIPSDLDRLNKSEVLPSALSDSLTKDKKCIVLEFSLPSSSYATMALREVLRGEEPIEIEGPADESMNLTTQDEDEAEAEAVDMKPDTIDEQEEHNTVIKRARLELVVPKDEKVNP